MANLIQKHGLRADLIHKRRRVDDVDPVPTMPPEQQKHWDRWCNSLIAQAVAEQDEVLAYVITVLRKEFKSQIDLLAKETASPETAAKLQELRERLEQEPDHG
jgi:hypothetical protein